MSFASTASPSPFVKMRQVYWEAKRSFKKSVGQREDSCIISSDSELDIKLELLQAADNSFNNLMAILLDYSTALQRYMDAQDNLGLALFEYGTKDSTAAGELMCMSGKVISKAAKRHAPLKTSLMNLFREVQTFQFNATADTLHTVARLEKVRRSYRSGLMWMKNESTGLDPDVNKKLKNFRRVQDYIKHLKFRFDRVKLESMQKIDLLLLSRSNLFSLTLVPYRKAFKKMSKYSVVFLDFVLKNIPMYMSFNFVALKQLNKYSKTIQTTFQQLHSTEQASKKRAKEKKSAEKSKFSLVATPPVKTDHDKNVKGDSSDSIDAGKPQEAQCSKNEALLIDLNDQDQRQGQSSITTCRKHVDLSVPKYSDDLLLLSLEPLRNVNLQSSTRIQNFGNECKSLIDVLDPVQQNQVIGDSNDLPFWALIQSCGASKTNSKCSATNSVLAPTKLSSNLQSQSKWNDILIQFDPFTDESEAPRNDTEALDLC